MLESNAGFGETPNAFIFSLNDFGGLAPFVSKVKKANTKKAIDRSSVNGPMFGQNRLFRIQARDLVMHVSRHFSCSDNCRRSTSSRLKVACTAHYNTVIPRVTKQMFTNVKTKKINGLFYNSVL